MIRKGQSILEFSLVFIIIAALILGLLQLWRWSKENIRIRQDAFDGSRIDAGTKTQPGQPEFEYFGAGKPPQKYFLSR